MKDKLYYIEFNKTSFRKTIGIFSIIVLMITVIIGSLIFVIQNCIL